MVEKLLRISSIIVVTAVAVVVCTGCRPDRKQKYSNKELETLPYAKRTNLPAPTGTLAVSVNDEAINSDEIISIFVKASSLTTIPEGLTLDDFRRQAAPIINKIVNQRISDILLYAAAKAKAPAELFAEDGKLDKAVKQETRNFVSRNGGDYYKAQRVLERNGFTWESFQEYERRSMVIQSYLNSTLDYDKIVRRKEVEEKYMQMRDEEFALDPSIEFILADIRISKYAEQDIVDPRKKAMDTAKEIYRRSMEGEDFAELVKELSNGIKASTGGYWKITSIDSLASPYDAISDELKRLKPGEVSRIIEYKDDVFIFKLVSKQLEKYKPLDQVYDQVVNVIRDQRREKATEDLTNQLIRQANIEGLSSFKMFCVDQSYYIIKYRQSANSTQ